MATPTLRPTSNTSVSKLSATGTHSAVASSLAYGIYSSAAFVSGAVDQVAYTYQKLGGDILDVELKDAQVYNSYEESLLEYSYLVYIHQAKNILSNVLGGTTGSFDEDGQLESGHSALKPMVFW